MAGPFYFAWVNATETSFNYLHEREDEKIAEFAIEHLEGEKPTLSLVIKNPKIGLLASGRKVWGWLSWDTSSIDGIIPLFFGRLTAIPTDILGQTCTLKFVAESYDFLQQKQIVAETLKVRPNYDPIFLDDAHRDDPDAILEGYSRLWHIDRTTLAVTASDITSGEDGTEVFTAADVPYDSVQLTLGQAPLQGVNVDATVKWTQRASGTVDIGQRTFFSYSGQSLISDWPKTGRSLGQGWNCLSSFAIDTYGVSTAEVFTRASQFKNNDTQHAVGDVMSIDDTSSFPILGAAAFGLPNAPALLDADSQCIKVRTHLRQTFARIDPYDPDFHDVTTASSQATYLYIPYWRVDTNLVLRYDAARQRSEHLVFTLYGNVQPVVTPETTPPIPVEETISVSGTDVGEPLFDVLDWLSVKAQPVLFGQVMFPDLPSILGGLSYQVCLAPGTAGTVEPDFSHIIGEQTVDGTVTWVCIGENPNYNVSDWTANTFVPVGALIRPLTPVWALWADLVARPPINGANISYGQICKASNGAYQICQFPGTTGRTEPAFSSTYGVTTQDYEVTWVCIGNGLPDGTNYFICTQQGTTAEIVRPSFDNTSGHTTADGTVIWKSLGHAGSFVDIPIGDMSRRSYFPTDRGLWSVEYLVCRAVALLKHRARCIDISFDCRFERAIHLSCRKNATLNDPRLPGGVATGKIKGYRITANGDKKELIGNVTIGCTVGKGGTVSPDAGTPTYVENGYVNAGYQTYIDDTVPILGSSVGYSTPEDDPNDDGLVFPLTRDQAVAREAVWGTTADQQNAISGVIPTILLQARLQDVGATVQTIANQILANSLSRYTVETAIAGSPIWYDLELRPLTNGPFNTEYQIVLTDLQLTQQIDLSAPAP